MDKLIVPKPKRVMSHSKYTKFNIPDNNLKFSPILSSKNSSIFNNFELSTCNNRDPINFLVDLEGPDEIKMELDDQEAKEEIYSVLRRENSTNFESVIFDEDIDIRNSSPIPRTENPFYKNLIKKEDEIFILTKSNSEMFSCN